MCASGRRDRERDLNAKNRKGKKNNRNTVCETRTRAYGASDTTAANRKQNRNSAFLDTGAARISNDKRPKLSARSRTQ